MLEGTLVLFRVVNCPFCVIPEPFCVINRALCIVPALFYVVPALRCVKYRPFCVIPEPFCVINRPLCIVPALFCVVPDLRCVKNRPLCVIPEPFCVINRALCIVPALFYVVPDLLCVKNRPFCVIPEPFCVINRPLCIVPALFYVVPALLCVINTTFCIVPEFFCVVACLPLHVKHLRDARHIYTNIIYFFVCFKICLKGKDHSSPGERSENDCRPGIMMRIYHRRNWYVVLCGLFAATEMDCLFCRRKLHKYPTSSYSLHYFLSSRSYSLYTFIFQNKIRRKIIYTIVYY